MLVIAAARSSFGWFLNLPVETSGTHVGGISRFLPMPKLQPLLIEKIVEVLPSPLFALLGSIQALLSAVVADNRSGRRNHSNCELVAKGLADVASTLLGGICLAGTIACTVAG